MQGNLLEVIKATTLGLAVGDALGVPYEFLGRNQLAALEFSEMQGYGSHHQPPGTWSDDTSLTLCLMESLCGGLNYTEIAQKFESWLDRGYLTPDGIAFDVGITTRKAIKNFQDGYEATICGEIDEHSNGNGSLMRVSPLAFFLKGTDPNPRRIVIFKVSAITHGHSRSKIACWLYVETLIQLFAGAGKLEAVDRSWKVVNDWLTQEGTSEIKYFARCRSDIVQASSEQIRSSGYVIDTLEAALWSFLRGNSFEECVVHALALGDDTDTVAAVTGSLAGAFYGIRAIPNQWLNQLKKKSLIEDLCTQFAKSLPIKSTSDS
jgi:ADP-ribosylglycohydrolase